MPYMKFLRAYKPKRGVIRIRITPLFGLYLYFRELYFQFRPPGVQDEGQDGTQSIPRYLYPGYMLCCSASPRTSRAASIYDEARKYLTYCYERIFASPGSSVLPAIHIIHIIFPILMKKETVKKIINLVITILTAIASAFCVQSCRG